MTVETLKVANELVEAMDSIKTQLARHCVATGSAQEEAGDPPAFVMEMMNRGKISGEAAVKMNHIAIEDLKRQHKKIADKLAAL